MASLYWRGTTGSSGDNWNYAPNWYKLVSVGGTGGVPWSQKLTPSGRSPYGGDTVYIKDSLSYLIVGATLPEAGSVMNSQILSNCSRGGMSLAGTTYWWEGAGTSAGATATGPLNELYVSVGAPIVGLCAATKFSFNSEKMPLFWRFGDVAIDLNNHGRTDMSIGLQYFDVNFKGVLNGGYAAAAHNLLSTRTYAQNPMTQAAINAWGNNRLAIGLIGKLGRCWIPGWGGIIPSTSGGPSGPSEFGLFFGSIVADSNTTINTLEIHGQPDFIHLPSGTTCEKVVIEPSNTVAGITTNILIECSVAETTTAYSATSENDYLDFKGIKFCKSIPIQSTASKYIINIGDFPGNTGAEQPTQVPVYYNLWETDISNIMGGAADIVTYGSIFINDIVLEDSSLRISETSTMLHSFNIKKGEIKGNSTIDLRKYIPSQGATGGATFGVPVVLGARAAAYGHTGAKGILISSRDATFITHPNTTISF